MKMALVNGERREAVKDLMGVCEGCKQQVIPICGLKRVWHWRHKVDCECDRWWENEGPWHRAWKDNFPKECQEIIIRKHETEEWHRADVQTKDGYILEFQHSLLKADDRQARNIFYGEKLVWVVDGLRRPADKAQFDEFLSYARPINNSSQILSLHPFIEQCSILKEWSDCHSLVFFDFGSAVPLWCLLPRSKKGNHYAVEYSRQSFIDLHNNSLNGKAFSDLIAHLYATVFVHEYPEAASSIKLNQVQSAPRAAPQRQVVLLPRIRLSDLSFLERQLAQPSPRQRKRFRRF